MTIKNIIYYKNYYKYYKKIIKVKKINNINTSKKQRAQISIVKLENEIFRYINDIRTHSHEFAKL